MALTPEGFATRLARLKADLIEQSRRVQALIEAAFDAAFMRDARAAKRVVVMDETIDKVDVEIERACVLLLTEATGSNAALAPEQLRMALTIVKVNNELERIADAGVSIAEMVGPLAGQPATLPETMRIVSNSVVGILRDASISLDRGDGHLAKVVLASEDAVEEFKKAIVRDLTLKVASGQMSVDMAFLIQEITTLCEVMAGHCTNIAEQTLYLTSGSIFRHMGGHWQEVSAAAAS